MKLNKAKVVKWINEFKEEILDRVGKLEGNEYICKYDEIKKEIVLYFDEYPEQNSMESRYEFEEMLEDMFEMLERRIR